MCFVTTYVKPSSDSCYWWTSWSPSSCNRCTERHQMAVTSYKSVAWLKDEAALRQPVACSAAWRSCLLSSYEVLMPSFMLVSLLQKKTLFSSTQPSCPCVCLTLNNSVRNWQNSHLQGHLSTRSAGDRLCDQMTDSVLSANLFVKFNSSSSAIIGLLFGLTCIHNCCTTDPAPLTLTWIGASK